MSSSSESVFGSFPTGSDSVAGLTLELKSDDSAKDNRDPVGRAVVLVIGPSAASELAIGQFASPGREVHWKAPRMQQQS